MDLTSGVILSLIAGSMLGTFAWPMKKISGWKWEHIWLVYSIWALIILPWSLAFITVPNLLSLYTGISPIVILTVFLFGAGWGIASIGFGIGMDTLGIAMGTAIVLGLNNAVGAILPIVIYNPDELLTPSGKLISIGVGVMIVGIIICAIAGLKKEQAINKTDLPANKNFKKGIIICLISGVLAAMFNFALVAGKPIEEEAIRLGASNLNAANPTWTISLLGGFLITAIYCGYKIRKGKSLALFTSKGSVKIWGFTFIMGLMWFGGVALYGTAVINLG